MSIISLNVGQCGNQLGGEFYNILYEDCLQVCNSVNSVVNDMYVQNSLNTFYDLSPGIVNFI